MKKSSEQNSPSLMNKIKLFFTSLTEQEKGHLLLYIAVTACIVLIRVRLLSTPFERDEGEYAYIGQTLLHGGTLFKDAYTMKLPGTSIMYAVWMLLFGETVEGIHLGLLITNIISAFLIIVLVKKWGGTLINGLVASIVFYMMSLSQGIYGFAAHATHFVTLYVVLALILFEIAIERASLARYLVAGIVFGIALSMKQQGALFLLLPIIFIVQERSADKSKWSAAIIKIFVTLFGASIPSILLAFYISSIGSFDKFYFWVVQYSSAYGARVGPIVGSLIFLNTLAFIMEKSAFFWVSAFMGLIYACSRWQTKFAKRSIIFLGVGFLVASLGFYFRNHYFVVLIPALAMLVSMFIDYMQSKISQKGIGKHGAVIILAVMVVASFAFEVNYYFLDSPNQVVDSVYGKLNVFTKSKHIAEFIKMNTNPEDKIEVLGSEPQIYFYSNRRAASGHIYMYGLMEHQEYAQVMQQELISDIMRERPKYIVFSTEVSSWMITPESDMTLWDWYKESCTPNYEVVSLGVLDRDTLTHFIYGDDIAKNKASVMVLISKRIDY